MARTDCPGVDLDIGVEISQETDNVGALVEVA